MKNKKISENLVIYQAKSGAIELKGDFSRETIWASQQQIAYIFGVERSVITKHIRNIFKDKELDEKAVCAKFAHTAEDGKTYQVQFYNLDIVLAVGYRANSKVAIEFRKWATKTLRGYIIDGYMVNKSQIVKNYSQFLSVVDDIKKLLPKDALIDSKDTIELVALFADTWLSLDAYDKEALPKGKLTKKRVELTSEKMVASLADLKKELKRKKEATEIFGQERATGSVAGIVGNVMQTFSRRELYPSIEEKAAHLLYFMVKSHPFVDGNKRNGAFAFVWFLRQAKILDVSRLTPSALTALTILVASSDPKDKEKVVRLILSLIAKK